jgi:BAAT / Acyl-CoA thioester hydrolase C terminal/Acyl-CoA thioester hydrolase/BAAT N-terminal region
MKPKLFAIAAALIVASPGIAGVAAPARIHAAAIVLPGDPPNIVVDGLAPRERVRLHAYRQQERWERDPATGQWTRRVLLMHGWADFDADRRGAIRVERQRPLAGTYAMIDGLGLIWSAFPPDAPEVAHAAATPPTPAEVAEGDIALVAERRGQPALGTRFRFAETRPATTVLAVSRPGLVGVFAAPPGARAAPTLIFLHGSEGGSLAKARAAALGYAERGFATLALVWFTNDYERTENAAPVMRNIPVEMLAAARTWLATRPEADTARIGLVGNSKGAEFALLGAATYDWVRAVVACVPSDVIWEGDVAGAEAGTASTWSLGGRPLPYIPLYPFTEGNPDHYLTNTERYERSRRDHRSAVAAARIPIERSRARLLLIGADRDEVWASGAMTRAIGATMARAGRGRQVASLVFPTAGHQICGDGTFPVRTYERQRPEPGLKVLTDEGHANVIAFRRKIAFLDAALARR